MAERRPDVIELNNGAVCFTNTVISWWERIERLREGKLAEGAAFEFLVHRCFNPSYEIERPVEEALIRWQYFTPEGEPEPIVQDIVLSSAEIDGNTIRFGYPHPTVEAYAQERAQKPDCLAFIIYYTDTLIKSEKPLTERLDGWQLGDTS